MQHIALMLLLVMTLAGCRSDVEPPLDDDLLRARHASLVIETDVMAYCRRGYDFAGMNTTNRVWNLQLSKTFGRRSAGR